jgi:hypothetical protein
MKFAIRKIVNLLLSLSFGMMIVIGLLMAYELLPTSHSNRAFEAPTRDWADPGAFLINTFFTLATLNLLVIWAWLIRCAAHNDFLRLTAGLLVGALIISTLLVLTPSYCSRAR